MRPSRDLSSTVPTDSHCVMVSDLASWHCQVCIARKMKLVIASKKYQPK